MACTDLVAAVTETVVLGSFAVVLSTCLFLFVSALSKQQKQQRWGARRRKMTRSHWVAIMQITLTIIGFVLWICFFWESHNEDNDSDDTTKHFAEHSTAYKVHYSMASFCCVTSVALMTEVAIDRLQMAFKHSIYAPSSRRITGYRLLLGSCVLGCVLCVILAQLQRGTHGSTVVIVLISSFLFLCFAALNVSVTGSFVSRLLDMAKQNADVHSGDSGVHRYKHTGEMSTLDKEPIGEGPNAEYEKEKESLMRESADGSGESDAESTPRPTAASTPLPALQSASAQLSDGLKKADATSASAELSFSFKSSLSSLSGLRRPTIDQLRQLSLSHLDENSQPLIQVATKHVVLVLFVGLFMLICAIGAVIQALSDGCNANALIGRVLMDAALFVFAVCTYLLFGVSHAHYIAVCSFCDKWCTKYAMFQVTVD